MDAAFPAAAFLLTLAATARSLGLGLGAAVAVGYFNGVIRANYLGVFSTFMFDAGLLGFYIGAYAAWSRKLDGMWAAPGAGWVAVLICWPCLLALVPINDLLVQLVALRGTVWFLPVLLIASRLTCQDLDVYARVLAVMNLVALAGGIYVYQYGLEALFPRNAITEIMYRSGDVAGNHFHRIPSFFLSAHAYGGAMLYSLPVLTDRLAGFRVHPADRALALAGLAAAVVGILLCAARMPVVLFGLGLLGTWVCTRFSPRVGWGAAAVVLGGAVLATSDERLQRAASLENTEYISDRIAISANESFLECLVAYPGGAGMGSSVGTSIPFFLADRAPQPVGLENEFCRILIDQGWVGFVAWLGFLGWLFGRPPAGDPHTPWGVGIAAMYGLLVPTWATGFIGTGVLSSVPGSVMMMVMMGALLKDRVRA